MNINKKLVSIKDSCKSRDECLGCKYNTENGCIFADFGRKIMTTPLSWDIDAIEEEIKTLKGL